MKRYIFITIIAFATIFTAFANPKAGRRLVKLETNKGTIVVALYNETPLHRDNFLKLTKRNFFDGTLFHRVINDFMIQGGDPDSKYARKGEALGNGGPGYDIKAEIRKGLIHKKGALAAAREGDNVNPERKSAGSQFYLVKGKVFSLEELANRERTKNAKLRSSTIAKFKREYKTQIDSLIKQQRLTKDTIPLAKFIANLNDQIDTIVAKKGFHFTEQQKQAYSTIGGVPHLDGGYTVFGEIVKGLEVVDKISATPTDKNDRPLEDIIIKKVTIIK